jgi:cytochrome c5
MHDAGAGIQAVTPSSRSTRTVLACHRVAALGLMSALLAWALPASSAGSCALMSASGRLCFAIKPLAPPRVGAYASWQVKVTEEGGQAAELSLGVRGGMPAHGHGLPSTPTVRRQGRGEFLVEGLLFNMPGDWVLVFDARADGARPDPATYRLRIEH